MQNPDPRNCCICNPGLRKNHEEHANCKTKLYLGDIARRYCMVTGDYAEKKLDNVTVKSLKKE